MKGFSYLEAQDDYNPNITGTCNQVLIELEVQLIVIAIAHTPRLLGCEASKAHSYGGQGRRANINPRCFKSSLCPKVM